MVPAPAPPAPKSLGLIGAGRVAQALGRRLVEGGMELFGVWARRPEAARAAAEFCQGGLVLGSPTELAGADCVLLALSDGILEDRVREAAELGAVRDGSLWIHTSGRHDLEPLAPVVEAGGRIASLHPVCPIPDREEGYRQLGGSHAVLQGGPEVREDLEALVARAGMIAHWAESGDRVLYHAACAMAANGLTALFDVVLGVMSSSGMPKDACRELPMVLMRAALDAIQREGVTKALSGPVVRGDTGTVADHLQHLSDRRPEALPTYRALLGRAALMALRRGDLNAQQYTALAAELQFAP